MARYQVQGPDGQTHIFEGPDGATPEQVVSVAQQMFGGAAHQAIANRIDNDAISQGARNFADNMSGVEKFAAGYGKAIPDIAMGIGQRIGLVSQDAVDERKKIDAPLMKTGAGIAGNIAGNVAPMVPAAFIPGAASIPGAAAIGGVSGLIQPTGSDESALKNVAIGAALGGGSVVGGRALAGTYQGVKALAEPFYEGGRQRIAGRMIQRFAENPSSIGSVGNVPTVTGALPTLAEQTGDAGLARLQDSLRSVDPQINNQIGARLSDNNAARINSLRQLAGDDGARDFAAAHRASTAQAQYERAFSVPVRAEDLSPQMRGEATKIMNLPAVQDAVQEAKRNAANFGMSLNEDNSIAGMHQAKLAMDDAISKLSGGGAVEANKAAGIRAARDRLVTFMEKMSPDYSEARQTYAQMSRPVNQMDIASNLLRRGASNGSDLSGNQLLNRNALLSALRDEPALIQKATGRKGLGQSLSDVLEPEQLNMLQSIAGEVDRAGAVAQAGNGPGSATAQRMASQNILRQLVGPTGLPQSWAESALANTVVGKPFNLLYGGVAEPRIQQALANAVLNPEQARLALQAAQQQTGALPNNLLMRLAGQARRSTSPAIARERQ